MEATHIINPIPYLDLTVCRDSDGCYVQASTKFVKLETMFGPTLKNEEMAVKGWNAIFTSAPYQPEPAAPRLNLAKLSPLELML